jgi:glucose-1-phosphate cytidylyltransferase
MKAVILAGGLGTRISEETDLKPKPMIEVGQKPLLWHVMKIYAAQGIDEFVVCLGYRGYVIKEYFANYYLHMGDVTFDLRDNSMEVHQSGAEPWRVTLIDTGDATQTGGRLKRVLPYVEDDDEFLFTYGDGVADLDLNALLGFHREQGCLATLTAVQPRGRWGSVELDGDRIRRYEEKPKGDGGWINGGFFVLSPEVGRYVAGDGTIWERDPLQGLAEDGQLAAYRHSGFWHAVDTLRDKRFLQEQWDTGRPPWKLWD